jgi:hypothetical protein
VPYNRRELIAFFQRAGLVLFWAAFALDLFVFMAVQRPTYDRVFSLGA